MQYTFPGHKGVLSLVLVYHDLQREIGRCQQRSNAHASCVSCPDSNNSGSGGSTSTPRAERTPADAQIPYEATLPARGWAIHYPPASSLRRAGSTGRAAARSNISAAGTAAATAAGGGSDAGAAASSQAGPGGRV